MKQYALCISNIKKLLIDAEVDGRTKESVNNHLYKLQDIIYEQKRTINDLNSQLESLGSLVNLSHHEYEIYLNGYKEFKRLQEENEPKNEEDE